MRVYMCVCCGFGAKMFLFSSVGFFREGRNESDTVSFSFEDTILRCLGKKFDGEHMTSGIL